MFAEYLENSQWKQLMAGVKTCVFTLEQGASEIPGILQPSEVEVVYCVEGGLSLKRENGTEGKLGPKEILLLSSCSHLLCASAAPGTKALCLHVETKKAGESFSALCAYLGNLPLDMKQIGRIMEEAGGLRILPATPWSRSAFYTLKTIAEEDWGHYIVLKTLELLYLMCTRNVGLDGQSSALDNSSYMNGIAENMRIYIENHLDEKLTILEMSRRFHLSRTACKSCFRACYGQPIHSWILDRRMEQATDLLEHTNMPVLQIAQSVGYSGVSQFNAAFKQRYGKTPREYRKMTVSVHC